MFFNNYNKPGKGVNKRRPDEPRHKIYMDVLPRKLWNLCKLNMLYLLVAIPFFLVTMFISGVISSPIIDSLSSLKDDTLIQQSLVWFDILLRVEVSLLFTVTLGLGPVTAGFSYIVREHSRELPCWLVSDFFEKFRENFKQSIILWIIDLAVFYLFAVAANFYLKSNMIILFWLICVTALIYLMMHLYMYPIMITFDLPLKHIFKNSLLMALGKAPKNLLLVLMTAALHLIIPVIVIVSSSNFIALLVIVLLELLVLPAFTGFTSMFCIYPEIDKYINQENYPSEPSAE